MYNGGCNGHPRFQRTYQANFKVHKVLREVVGELLSRIQYVRYAMLQQSRSVFCIVSTAKKDVISDGRLNKRNSVHIMEGVYQAPEKRHTYHRAELVDRRGHL